MSIRELRDAETARTFVLQGLWLQRIAPCNAQTIADPLSWTLELIASGEPVPPVGFVADVGRLAFGWQTEESVTAAMPRTAVRSERQRAYEDYVLGKLYADATFERASAAICRYSGRDRDRALAWLVARFRERAGVGAVVFSPTVVRGLQRAPVEKVLAAGAASLDRDGLLPLLQELYDELIEGTRNVGEVLGVEDVFELEHGTALVEFGQRLALRQVLQTAQQLEEEVPRQAPRLVGRRYDVPTHVLDEDAYPVGGFSSISTRGSIESLLHSQLAYMERGMASRPDLFDIKFLRSELLYYSRDENEFLRRRRTFVFALFSDLVHARVKDPQLPCQRIVLLLATLLVIVRRLIDWLSEDALRFEFVFVQEDDDALLQDERELVELILAEQIANGTVVVKSGSLKQLRSHVNDAARRSLCHCLSVATRDRSLEFDHAVQTRLIVDGPHPKLRVDEADIALETSESYGWNSLVAGLLTLLR